MTALLTRTTPRKGEEIRHARYCTEQVSSSVLTRPFRLTTDRLRLPRGPDVRSRKSPFILAWKAALSGLGCLPALFRFFYLVAPRVNSPELSSRREVGSVDVLGCCQRHILPSKGSSVDHADIEARRGLTEVIDTLVEAETVLLSAQTVMRDTSLADRPSYESIERHIGVALASARTALAEAHNKLHGL